MDEKNEKDNLNEWKEMDFLKRVALELKACETLKKKKKSASGEQVVIGLAWSKKRKYHSGHQGEQHIVPGR